MTTLSANVVLSEVDSEITLLGSLFMSPDAFARAVSNIRPEWFSDSFLRYMFEAARKMHDEGARLTPAAVVASLPQDCGGLNRGAFYAKVCAAAMPVNSIGGLVRIVKDRWARRELLASADLIKARAENFTESPYDLASEIIVSLDGITADRSERGAASLDAALEEVGKDKPMNRGATTGLYALDNKLNGYVPGQLYVIAGRPGMGKSAFMCSSLRQTAQSGRGVAVFSLEMSAEEIACRCVSDALDSGAAPFFGNILKGSLSANERADVLMAKDSLSGLPFYIEDNARLTFSEITAKAREIKATFEAKGIRLAVICIDHMGLVTPSNRYAGNKVAEAGEVSGQARALAKELDCCIMLLCQLSREVEKRDDKRPVMSDLRWSGEIEQDAHVIGFLYREHYYLQQDAMAMPHQLQDAKHKLEFLIRKNRNGETADVSLWCSIGHSRIRDNL
jgi:replicative DNA helicase